MDDATLICHDEQRRHKVRAEGFNGLDYLEVNDDQRTLTAYFLGKAPEKLTRLLKEDKVRAMKHVRIVGGRRIRDIRVIDLDIRQHDDPDLDDCLLITVDKPGDFSTYRLCLVDLDGDDRPTDRPFPNFDPRYACLDFSFKEGCPSDLDCKPQQICPPPDRVEPEINYLAKDYASFRQLILDRLALIMPDWQERHVPDLGIALVEILAYAGDHLSYYQDAVATEAYLETARQRISVRRHARLVDYLLHEGCNARAWVCLETDTDVSLMPKEIAFITGHNDVLPVREQVLTWYDLRNVPANQYEVFEPLVEKPAAAIQLYAAHNSISFYTWGDQECCLPRGATSATLKDAWVQPEVLDTDEPGPQQQSKQEKQEPEPPPPEPERELRLKVGDVLIFEEVIGPKTNNPADADPSHRHPVRLTRLEPGVDALYHQPIVEIEWAEADALPFPLCISGIGPSPACDLIEDISVARGNVILVDHGQRIETEGIGQVPLKTATLDCGDECHPAEIITEPDHFRPWLQKAPLTFSQPVPAAGPAADFLLQDPRQALPQIDLSHIPAAPDGLTALFQPHDLIDPTGFVARLLDLADAVGQVLRAQLSLATQQLLDEHDGAADLSEPLRTALIDDLNGLLQPWTPRRDLLASYGLDRHFVVEMDNGGRAHLRFGDGELGRMPEAGALFQASYRVGNGLPGNVGAEAISHLVSRELLSGVKLRPRNPLPAQGGMSPEPLAEVKLFAPYAFQVTLQRAITADDYASLVMRDFKHKVQRAAATLRWTGSWYEVLVVVDPLGQMEADPALLAEIRAGLYRHRRIGHDLVVAPARYVPLDIEMTVCVLPDYLRGHVKAALLDRFSNRTLPDGQRGFFHPDNLTFGEGVYLSHLVAAVQTVPGVESVTVTKLERLYEGGNQEIQNGILPLGPLEVARLDNDPNFPENGVLKLNMEGRR